MTPGGPYQKIVRDIRYWPRGGMKVTSLVIIHEARRLCDISLTRS